MIHELLIVDDTVRSMIVKRTDGTLIKKAGVAAGMMTLREDGMNKVFAGMTTIEELMRATHSEV